MNVYFLCFVLAVYLFNVVSCRSEQLVLLGRVEESSDRGGALARTDVPEQPLPPVQPFSFLTAPDVQQNRLAALEGVNGGAHRRPDRLLMDVASMKVLDDEDNLDDVVIPVEPGSNESAGDMPTPVTFKDYSDGSNGDPNSFDADLDEEEDDWEDSIDESTVSPTKHSGKSNERFRTTARGGNHERPRDSGHHRRPDSSSEKGDKDVSSNSTSSGSESKEANANSGSLGLSGGSETSTHSAASSGKLPVVWGATGAVGLLGVGMGALLLRRRTHVDADTLEGGFDGDGLEREAELSPEGWQ